VNRFNLTFRGEILEGHDPEQARAGLAQALAIEDPDLLQRLFCGDPVVLRRNMERKEAAGLYARLRQLGIQAELVKIGERGDLHSGEAVKALAATTAPAIPPVPPAPSAPSAPVQDTGGAPPDALPPDTGESAREAIRKADLAAKKSLQAQDRARLEAKEKVLQQALKAKQKEDAKRDRASARTREKALAREASQNVRLEAARKKSELAEKRRRAEAEAAERRAQQQAAAQRQAELEQAKEAAFQAELQAARERLEAEKRERLATERAEREQREAEERQRLAAEQAEREQREAEERRRLAAEQAEREQREAEERRRLAAERAEREQARLEEQRRLAAEKAARREEERREAEQLAARLQVEQARRKREQAAESARRRAEEVRRRAQEQARLQAEEEERLAQRRAMEEQAIRRAATELAHKPALKPVGARVRTRLETPSRHRSGEAPAQGRRKRQPGAPNLYSMRPFRNTPEIRARADQSHRIMRLAFIGAAVALAAALALGARLLSLSPPALITGASAIVIGPGERPLLLAGDHLLLHDRSGASVADLSLDSLGLVALQAPLAFDQAGNLLAAGLLAGAGGAPTALEPAQLLRCVLAESRCEQFPADLSDTVISALAAHPLDGSLFIADSSAGRLLKLGAEGAVLARADAAMPPAPVMGLDSGLLLVNSPQGAAISVFRYEDKAFGQQLDEVLLLPPPGATIEFTGVRDFLRNGEHWWVLLERAGSDAAGLYRFDAQWQFVDQPALVAGARPARLVNWGNRVLVVDPAHIPVQRFNSDGAAEAPLVSTALTQLGSGREHRANLILLGWRLGLALCALVALAGLCTGSLHRVRSLVYKSCRERGAEPIDRLADAIDWIELAPDRSASLGRTGIAFAVLATGLVLGAIGLGVTSLQLSALLLALAGPAAALILLQRSDPGHIGILDSELLLVDHTGMYHLGSGGRIQCRGPFLMLDDVTVFTGTQLLPAFSPAEIAQRVAPLAAEGVRVDRKIVTVKLLQARHPLALGAVAILAACAAALALLSLQGIF
jgi:hypothetical protein